MATPAWTRTSSPAAAGPTRLTSTSSMRPAATTSACDPRHRPDLGHRPFVTAGHAVPLGAFGVGGASRPGCSRADVGQLPQQVVEEHQAAVAGGQRPGRRRPATRCGRPAGPRAGARRPARWRSVPRRSDRRTTSSATGSSAGPTPRRTSPGRDRRRSARIGFVPVQAGGGKGPLAHDDRMHELHGQMPGVSGPPGSQTPEGGPGVNRRASGQGGHGQALGHCIEARPVTGARGHGGHGPSSRQPATTAWPRARPPSLGGTLRWVSTSKPAETSRSAGQPGQERVLEDPAAEGHLSDPGGPGQPLGDRPDHVGHGQVEPGSHRADRTPGSARPRRWPGSPGRDRRARRPMPKAIGRARAAVGRPATASSSMAAWAS